MHITSADFAGCRLVADQRFISPEAKSRQAITIFRRRSTKVTFVLLSGMGFVLNLKIETHCSKCKE